MAPTDFSFSLISRYDGASTIAGLCDAEDSALYLGITSGGVSDNSLADLHSQFV